MEKLNIEVSKDRILSFTEEEVKELLRQFLVQEYKNTQKNRL